MAEEFQAGVCGGNQWNNSSRSVFGSSPCSSVINDIGNVGGWPSDHLVDIKPKSSDESSDGSMVIFQDIQKPSGGTTMDSTTLQIMGIGISSSTIPTDWNQSLLRAEGNYNFSEDSSIDAIKVVANQGFSIDQQPLNFITISGNCTSSFPVSTTPSYPNYPSTLVQTLFDSNSPPQQQTMYDNGSMSYGSMTNDFRTNLGDFWCNSLTKFSQASLVKPKQQISGGLHLSNKTPYWNSSNSALNDIRGSFFPSTQSQFLSSTYEENPSCPNLGLKSNNEEIRDSASVVKKSCSEPAFKRPRLETPSPLPTFKVRKEKLGDRITALQQLVSPFGKTDTASVLHEAIEYIKLLHEQVNVLSTPYMKNGAAIQRQQISEKVKENEGAKQDLRSRGLCLVPVSSTFPVTTETAADFWTPTFGGAFR